VGDGGEDKAARTCGLGEMGRPTGLVDEGADSEADREVRKDIRVGKGWMWLANEKERRLRG
jgi:hypothetical protein